MSNEKHPTGRPFTAFRSAAEEAEMKAQRQSWDNEGGQTSSTAGRAGRLPSTGDPTTYGRPASNAELGRPNGDKPMNDESILARLKVIDERLRQISSEDAASVLAGGLANAGIHEHERLRLVAETELILDELDGPD
jgi:hypothetical protein